MIILSANNINKAYGTDVILKDISFHMNKGDRVGLIGNNGAGKTTLMKILSGEMSYDSGNYYVSQDTTIGYLKQNDGFDTADTVSGVVEKIFEPLHRLEKELLELSAKISELSEKGEDVEKLLHMYDNMRVEFENKGGYSYKSEMQGVLQSMAFDESAYEKKIGSLSGGERTRLALACLLLKKPDLLFLDEPTNHLDIGTLKWLEQYLKSYSGTILFISHDRYFLDQTVNRIFEIENHRLSIYEGNYSNFASQKRSRREAEMKKYEQQQKEIQRQEEIIRRFKQHNTEHLTKRAASREKMLEHMERIEKPEALAGKMKIRFKQEFQSGNDVLIAENLKMGFGYGQNRRELFKNVSFDIKRGERICIVGANGIGKTTLLKIMQGMLEPDSGYLKTGHNVAFGYYDQGQRLLTDSNTVLEELKESYRLYSDTEMRSILGRFLFRNEMVFLEVGSLSGGERARLSLAKLMLSGANVLVLDEPTNHLDINSKEVFEDALLDFPGTVIVVSHDRYFLNKIPTRILEVTADGLNEYLGTYNYYVEKKQSVESGKKYLNSLAGAGKAESGESGEQAAAGTVPEAQLSVSEQRRLNKEKETKRRRIQKLRERLEGEIESLEDEIRQLEEKMCMPENLSDHRQLLEWDEEAKRLKSELADTYDEWLGLENTEE
ncbi:MAG: ABC-F family ATP-binding cassette domain-containing protein [Clostridia bacterium]|nr:ABC-F family ATP-binding cassette domain-containing protein [Clostridia bacterium]